MVVPSGNWVIKTWQFFKQIELKHVSRNLESDQTTLFDSAFKERGGKHFVESKTAILFAPTWTHAFDTWKQKQTTKITQGKK